MLRNLFVTCNNPNKCSGMRAYQYFEGRRHGCDVKKSRPCAGLRHKVRKVCKPKPTARCLAARKLWKQAKNACPKNSKSCYMLKIQPRRINAGMACSGCGRISDMRKRKVAQFTKICSVTLNSKACHIALKRFKKVRDPFVRP